MRYQLRHARNETRVIFEHPFPTQAASGLDFQQLHMMEVRIFYQAAQRLWLDDIPIRDPNVLIQGRYANREKELTHERESHDCLEVRDLRIC